MLQKTAICSQFLTILRNFATIQTAEGIPLAVYALRPCHDGFRVAQLEQPNRCVASHRVAARRLPQPQAIPPPQNA